MKTNCKAIGFGTCLLFSLSLVLGSIGCAGDRYHRSTGAYFDDKATTAKVKADFIADPVVRGSEVKVKTYQGKVQLSGFVDTQAQKDRASEIARRINGVQWVKNDLIVKSTLPMNPGAPTSPAPTAGSGVSGSISTEPAGGSSFNSGTGSSGSTRP